MLSRPSTDSPSPQRQIPSIRLISATPSAAGISSEANASFSNSFDSSWASISPVPLAPKSDAPARKRLVPKKSKLGLLGASNKENKREKDLSDITHRVGANTSSVRGGFEIYVDSSNDPELEDIVVVKKKKSRAALDGMSWGALGEVTNVPAVARNVPSSDNLLKVKNDEEKKWWSIGRGRKDSKEKEKEKEGKENSKRAKSPEVSMRSQTPDLLNLNQEGRARFNSLDSGILLNTPINMGFSNRKTSTSSEQQCPAKKATRSFTPESLKEACQDIESLPPLPPSRSNTPAPTLNGFLAPSNAAGKEQGSIALRAIRSVKSLARMASWAPTAPGENRDGTIKDKKDKKEKKEKKERKEKENQDGTVREKKKKHKKEKKEKKETEGTLRYSTSSFETDDVDATPRPLKSRKSQTLGKKHSILGLGIGLPGSMRLPSVRNGSTSSSILLQPSKLSVDGSGLRLPKERMGSIMSTSSSSMRPPKGSTMSSTSSGRPMSTASSSGASAFTRDSKGSVRWDEAVLRDGKREMQKEKKQKKAKAREEGKESRRSSDGRKRTLITDVFPEIVSNHDEHLEQDEYEHEALQKRYSTAFPIVTIEEATADGHETTDIHDSVVYGGIASNVVEDEEPRVSPVKRHRTRPMSEQLLGKSRPRPMHEDDEGVLSILDAATNDLALLINHLDLEATPSTPDMTPLKPLPPNILDSTRPDVNFDSTLARKSRLALGSESPLKNKSPPNHANNSLSRKVVKLRTSVASITSLRPYAQSRGNATKTLSTPILTGSLGKSTLKNKSSESTIGQPISPWPVLIQQLSPLKERKASKGDEKENIHSHIVSPTGTWKKGHKRTMTPGPEPDPAPVFHALRPPKPRPVKVPEIWDGKSTLRASSSSFFAPANVSKANATKGSFSPPASLGRRASAFIKKRFSLLPVPAESSGGEDLSFQCAGLSPQTGSKEDMSFQCAGSTSPAFSGSNSNTSSEKKRRHLPATLGGSDVSCYRVPELDASDPDSDIPDELQFILKNTDYAEEDDTFNFNRRVSGCDQDYYDGSVELPRNANPTSPIRFDDISSPVFRAALTNVGGDMEETDDGEHADAESDADTKQSFDFTGELQKLNESGASDRRSFVEQLEKAFKTPAKVDLRCDFGTLLSFEVPPVPKIPSEFNLNKKYSNTTASEGVSMATDEEILNGMAESDRMVEDSEPEAFDMYEVTRLMDTKEPTLNLQSTKYEENTQTQQSGSCFNLESVSNIVDAQEPTLLFPWSREEDSAEGPCHIVVSNEPSYDLDNTFSTNHSRSASGELNTLFKFGGRPHSENKETKKGSTGTNATLTLSDIIPSPEHVRSLSAGSLEDDSVIKSIIARTAQDPQPQPRPRVMSNASSDMFLQPGKLEFRHSHASSISSFTGFDSFDEVRRGFEFHPNLKPQFYPAPIPATRKARHSIRDSFFSIASVSSYGHVINPGVPDPFDFGLPSLQERPSTEALSSSSYSIDDTFSFMNHASRRRRLDSDASSYYFNASAPRANHHRQDSNSSQNPPVSIYNRGFGAHRRNSSNSSILSRATRRRSAHRYNDSVDSIMSDFSVMRLGRPGVGDKMFEMADHLKPLASISASPESTAGSPANFTQQVTYDSIMDDDRVFSMGSDSLFDKTGQRTTFDDKVFSMRADSIFDKTDHRDSMMSEDSVFGGYDDDSRFHRGLFPLHQLRPLSMMSMSSVHPPPKEDDTMISMLGGGHVRRCSIGSVIQASPCARRVEKRKRQKAADCEEHESPSKARIVEKPSSFASTLQFRSNQILKAQQGLLEMQNLENLELTGVGEDTSSSFRAPVFTRPAPTTRSRSSTCTSSSGGDTPPLSASDGASISGSSLSSIDLSELNFMLSNATNPVSTLQQARARARGDGHRRRYSHVRNSRAESVYETIDEEDLSSSTTSPNQTTKATIANSPTENQQVFIVDGDTASIHSAFEEPTAAIWEDERGVAALRKFYALRDEAQNTVVESKRAWSDTPFSLFAIQSFQPPQNPEGMQALLQHSVQNYGPLPSELRPLQCRSRKNSRPSPYPSSRPSKVNASPEVTRMVPSFVQEAPPRVFTNPQALATKRTNNANIPVPTQTLGSTKQFLPMTFNLESKKSALNMSAKENQNATIRPRVASSTRRSALGWTKRSGGPTGSTGPANTTVGKMSTESNTTSRNQKENISMGSIISPGETLRLNRPRPKGRTTTSAAQKAAPRPIRI